MALCPGFDPLAPYVPTVVSFVDCHARALGQDGYRALGAGSSIGAVITGFITIYIGLIGYRMMLGDLPRFRDIVLAAVKIGAVLAISTQWSAYQVLVYGIVVDEPTALAARIFPAGGLGGDDLQSLTLKVETAYDDLEVILHPPQAKASPESSASPEAGGLATADPQLAAGQQRHALSTAEFESIQGAEKWFLAGTLGGLLSTRIVAGVLLALGPLFIGFFLFDATRGLFVGWVRALAATVVASIGVLAVLSIGLALFVPQVVTLSRALEVGVWVPTLINEVAVTSILFAILMATTLVGTGVAAFGLHLPDAARDSVSNLGLYFRQPDAFAIATVSHTPHSSTYRGGERSRAQAVANAVSAFESREETSRIGARATPAGNVSENRPSSPVVPMGQSPNRLTKRQSAKARQRDAAE